MTERDRSPNVTTPPPPPGDGMQSQCPGAIAAPEPTDQARRAGSDSLWLRLRRLASSLRRPAGLADAASETNPPDPAAVARLAATAELHLREGKERRAAVARLRAAAAVARHGRPDETRLDAFRSDLGHALRRRD